MSISNSYIGCRCLKDAYKHLLNNNKLLELEEMGVELKVGAVVACRLSNNRLRIDHMHSIIICRRRSTRCRGGKSSEGVAVDFDIERKLGIG